MDHFLGYFLPRLAERVPECATIVEAIAEGYKICHPDELDGKSLRHGLVYGDARDLSPNTVPTPTLASIGTSLRNPSPVTGSLTRISNRGTTNIVYENVTGKEEIDAARVITNIDAILQGLDDIKSHPYLNELIQILKSRDESRRSKSIISLLNYAITGSKKQSFADSKYVYEMDGQIVLCSIRLSNHHSSNDIIRREESTYNLHPQNRLSLVSLDLDKTNRIEKEGCNVCKEFDCKNPISKTEIVINPASLFIEKNESDSAIRNILKMILQSLKNILSHEVQTKGVMGTVALSLSSSLNTIVDVYQIDNNGTAFKNGVLLHDGTDNPTDSDTSRYRTTQPSAGGWEPAR